MARGEWSSSSCWVSARLMHIYYYCHMWGTFVCFIVLITCSVTTLSSIMPHKRKDYAAYCYLSFHLFLFWYCMDVRADFNVYLQTHQLWGTCVFLDFGSFGRCPCIIRYQNTLLFQYAATSYPFWERKPYIPYILKWEKDGIVLKFDISRRLISVPSTLNLVLWQSVSSILCLSNLVKRSKVNTLVE